MKTKVLITMAALLILSACLPSASAEVWQFQKTTNISFGGFDVMFFFDTGNASTYPTNGIVYVLITNRFLDLKSEGAYSNDDWNVSISKNFSIENGTLEVTNFTNIIPEFRKGESIVVKFERKFKEE